MNVSDFSYQLPDELIAQFPPEKRSDSRLLKVMQKRALEEGVFASIVDELRAGDLLVLNDTKVIPARVFAKKDSGGKVEILLERVTGEHSFLAQMRASRSPKVGQQIIADEDTTVQIVISGRQGQFFELEIDQQGSLFDWFERVGHMPLPPYIDRADNSADSDRYQTVFADQQGAVAAPTAGLHYDDELLECIRLAGVHIETITLHVGAGTYQPVRVDNVDDHQMHSETIEVSQTVCDAINQTKLNGGRVIAVGTTVVRSLETAAKECADRLLDNQVIQPFSGDTEIFIYPGFEFKVVDMLQTNFHLSESTLLMLVSAFAGYDRIMSAYQYAIDQQFRFFSYGDAMLLERSTASSTKVQS
jgi:S-adenosylmethionine:tRNA ribosyltransferase-isomerase